MTQDDVSRLRKRLDHEITCAILRFEEATGGRHRVDAIDVRRFEHQRRDHSVSVVTAAHAYTVHAGLPG